MIPTTDFLTSDQLARRLQLSPATITQYARAGRIAGAQKWGNRWRFDPNAVLLLPPGGEVTLPSTRRGAPRHHHSRGSRHFSDDMPLKQRLAEIRRQDRRTR